MPQVAKFETRTKILFASEKLFNQKGYSKTKITDIMNSCNMAAGTFYVYFKDKEILLTEIYQPIVDAIDAVFVLTPLPEKLTGDVYFEILKQEILRLSQYALKFSNELRFLLQQAHDSKYALFPEIMNQTVYSELEKFLTIGISHNFVRDAYIPGMAVLCCGVISTMIDLIIVNDNEHHDMLIVQETIDMLYYGLRTI